MKEGVVVVDGFVVVEGEKVGRITGVVINEQAGVAELVIGEPPQKQQQFPLLLFKINPGITGWFTWSLDPA